MLLILMETCIYYSISGFNYQITQKPIKKMLNINAPLNLIAVLMLMFFEASNILEKCIERKQWQL